MRIIGGAFRGRKLAAVGKGDASAHLRPTSDRVRESLFNILESNYADVLSGARVLDVFAGTGALGLEALSRGAAHVTFIDDGRSALSLLRANIATCGVKSQTTILARNATRPGPAKASATLVFLDPPYNKMLGEKALAALIQNGWLAHEAHVIWEESAQIVPPPSFQHLDQRRYGDTVIQFFRHDA